MEMLATLPQGQDLKIALARAVRHGLMSGNQYRFLVDRLVEQGEEVSLLVFGLGHDAPLWFRCAQGGTAFVEDDPSFLTMAPATARVYLHSYASRVGRWSKVPRPPRLIDRPWDFVIVDGPRGFSRDSPGRQIPIVWAQQLAARQVFVHDYERPWEREVCDKIFGHPAERIQPAGRRRGELAVFDV